MTPLLLGSGNHRWQAPDPGLLPPTPLLLGSGACRQRVPDHNFPPTPSQFCHDWVPTTCECPIPASIPPPNPAFARIGACHWRAPDHSSPLLLLGLGGGLWRGRGHGWAPSLRDGAPPPVARGLAAHNEVGVLHRELRGDMWPANYRLGTPVTEYFSHFKCTASKSQKTTFF